MAAAVGAQEVGTAIDCGQQLFIRVPLAAMVRELEQIDGEPLRWPEGSRS